MEQNNKSKILNAVDLVAYQNDSITSRTLLKKDTGTVTLFAFDEGQALSEHTAPFDAVVHILEGEAEIIIDGESFRLTKGEMIIMPANIPHALKALLKFKLLLTMIRS